MRVRDGGKDADLVESVLFLFWGKIKEFDFFEGINLVVLKPYDFVDERVGAFAEFG
jgi:hypothetical protein